jgi:hypothetical protein
LFSGVEACDVQGEKQASAAPGPGLQGCLPRLLLLTVYSPEVLVLLNESLSDSNFFGEKETRYGEGLIRTVLMVVFPLSTVHVFGEEGRVSFFAPRRRPSCTNNGTGEHRLMIDINLPHSCRDGTDALKGSPLP